MAQVLLQKQNHDDRIQPIEDDNHEVAQFSKATSKAAPVAITA